MLKPICHWREAATPVIRAAGLLLEAADRQPMRSSAAEEAVAAAWDALARLCEGHTSLLRLRALLAEVLPVLARWLGVSDPDVRSSPAEQGAWPAKRGRRHCPCALSVWGSEEACQKPESRESPAEQGAVTVAPSQEETWLQQQALRRARLATLAAATDRMHWQADSSPLAGRFGEALQRALRRAWLVAATTEPMQHHSLVACPSQKRGSWAGALAAATNGVLWCADGAAECPSRAGAFGQELQRALRRAWAAALAAAADRPAALQKELMAMSPPSLNAQLLEPLAAGDTHCERHSKHEPIMSLLVKLSVSTSIKCMMCFPSP